MPDATPPLPLLPVEAAVLLVLLPAPVSRADALPEATSPAALDALQRQLGTAVRVLCINESTHPTVVSSFHAADLPCFVLVQHGIERWRQCGLAGGGFSAPLLLRKLRLPGPGGEQSGPAQQLPPS